MAQAKTKTNTKSKTNSKAKSNVKAKAKAKPKSSVKAKTSKELIGCEKPRIYTKPKRKLTEETTLGYDFIEFAENMCGVTLMPWQKFWAIHALEIVNEKDGWRFRHRYILTEVSRQNGKTFILKLITAFFNLILQVRLVIGTAQNLDTAIEPFEETVEMLNGDPRLKSLIDKVYRGQGKRELRYKTGERYKVLASNRGARGLSSDVIIMDELREQRDWEAWGAISKTMMAKPNAVLFAFTNAGDARSVVLRSLREQAHLELKNPDNLALSRENLGGEDVDSGIALFEWSAKPECRIDDKKQWCQANPALGHGTITVRALESSMKTDPESVFRTECLCQEVGTVLPEPFPEGAWDAGLDKDSRIDELSEVYYAIDVSVKRDYSAIAVCGIREDGNYHIEVAEYRAGTAWAVDWFKSRANVENPIKLCFQGRGAPASGIGDDLGLVDGIEAVRIEGGLLTSGFAKFYDAICRMSPSAEAKSGIKVYHLGQPILEPVAKTAQIRNIGGDSFVLDRRRSPIDISPLMACTLAFSGATAIEKEDTKIHKSSYIQRNCEVITL